MYGIKRRISLIVMYQCLSLLFQLSDNVRGVQHRQTWLQFFNVVMRFNSELDKLMWWNWLFHLILTTKANKKCFPQDWKNPSTLKNKSSLHYECVNVRNLIQGETRQLHMRSQREAGRSKGKNLKEKKGSWTDGTFARRHQKKQTRKEKKKKDVL